MTFQFLLGKVRQKQCLTTTECGKWFQFLLGKVRQKKTKKGRCYVCYVSIPFRKSTTTAFPLFSDSIKSDFSHFCNHFIEKVGRSFF